MLKKFTLLTLFYCGFLSAGNLSHIDMELMLTQSATFFENVSLSELNFPENKEENERYFSFCLLENQRWGIAPRNKPMGYWINQDNQQPESFNCQRTISLQEFEGLLQYVLATEAKKSQWTIDRRWLCYNRGSNSNTASICHPVPSGQSAMTNDSEAINKFYKTGFWVVSAGLGLSLWGLMENLNGIGWVFRPGPFRPLLLTRIALAPINAVTRAYALFKRKRRP